ncbi:MAG: sugar ABC transporter ATP-binding protein [Deferribacteres bacterium]|nr:sugar ABC transporter ATP-binding protein [candidate division KSB1 bacterium]MCB9500590.1 sugar ABC transporter ATP-binding protein [Deferribacteres bacterium]
MAAVEKSQVPRLEMRGICKSFGATVALDEVSFSVLPGEVHALVGENGAGKSTLMKILSGAYTADSGEMLLDGEAYRPKNPLNGRKQGVAMIYQELSLAPHLSVEENIMLGVEPVNNGFIRWKDVRQTALKAIERFDHPEMQPEVLVRDLTVGAQQVVEIGRSLAIGCRVLVFDEPTSSLSQKDIDKLFEIIHSLKDQGISIIYISHFLEEVQEIADRLTVLRDGTVAGSGDTVSFSTNDIVRMMVGREVKDLYPRSNRTPGEIVLHVKDLAGMKKPQKANLELHRGEVLGICGLVGAGRTELMRTVFGLDAIKSGEVKIGVYAGQGSPMQRWRDGTGMLSENRKEEGLALNMSLADNVTLSRLQNFGPLNLVIPQKQEAATDKWIDRLDIRCRDAAQEVGALSGGNQQKVAFARLLQHNVDIFLLDEPTRGIDVAAKAKLYAVIDEIASGIGHYSGSPRAVLIISSYLPELLGICDRIAVMARGVLGEALPVDQVDEHQLMLAATGQGELGL